MNGPLWCPHLDLDLFFERLRVRQFNLKLGPPEAIQTHVSAHSTNRDSGLPIADSLEGGRHSFVLILEVHTVDFVSYVPSPLPPQSQSPLSLLPPRMQQQCVQCRSQEAKAAATNGRSFLLRIRTLTLASAVRFSNLLFLSPSFCVSSLPQRWDASLHSFDALSFWPRNTRLRFRICLCVYIA